MRVHNDYPVFILKTDLDAALKGAKSPQTFINDVVGKVFTSQCLKGSTAHGYPNRNQGSSKLRQKDVLPRVDPNGFKAIISK